MKYVNAGGMKVEVICNIKGVREDIDGTQLLIQAKDINIAQYIMEHRVRNGRLVILDGRFISPEQRRKAYATENDIAEFCGYINREEKAYVHEVLKAECMKAYKIEAFSLSDCTMDTARDYIAFLLEYAIENGIPLSDNLNNRAEEIDRALIACIKHRKCCLCGREGEIHHVDAIGMGNDRRKYDDSGNRIMCLCRTHHTEYHKIGREDFEKKYKVYGIERWRTHA